MKPWKCSACGADIEVYDEYEPKGCCNGHDCGCQGREINPVFCDDCEIKIYGRKPE